MLSAAQVTADRYVADARAYSSRLTDEARARRDEIIQDALRYSDALLDEAHASACEAADSALTTEHSPESESEQEPGPAELAYLRTYSDAYRAHLQAYTDTVLSSIEELAHTTTISLDQEQVAQLPDATAAYIS
jgi:cell division septum initiation protein DivIVA